MAVGAILPALSKCDEGVTFGVRGARALVDVAQELFDVPAREVSDLEGDVPLAVERARAAARGVGVYATSFAVSSVL
jgi:hypothetical protein